MATGSVYLIGFSGSGKTAIAPIVARRLKLPCYDTDAIIERRTRTTIAQLFASRGERTFRRLEADTITDLTSSPEPKVVALGGGALMSSASRRCVSRAGTVVYLSCAIGELYRRLKDDADRPLLSIPARPGETARQAGLRVIKSLLDERRQVYEYAHLKVSTTRRSPAQAAALICAGVRKLNA